MKSLVICGPSGVGKTTVLNLFQERNPSYVEPVSYYTHPTRKDDKSKYVHLSPLEFRQKEVRGEFICVSQFLGWKYGLPLSEIQTIKKGGSKLLMDYSLENLHLLVNLKEQLNALFVYLLPKNNEILLGRLRTRSDSSFAEVRYEKALREIRTRSDSLNWAHIDRELINEDLDLTIRCLEKMVSI